MTEAVVTEVPGTMPPGKMRPGNLPPGDMPPGSMPPGDMRPGQPEPGQPESARPGPVQGRANRGNHQVRSTAIAVALMLSFAGVIALLIIVQPFADAAGGCGGG